MNLHIYYRHYDTATGALKRRPTWFSYEQCLSNLLKTISVSAERKIFLTIVFDGTQERYENDFSSHLLSTWANKNKNINLSHAIISAGSDKSSFAQTVDMAAKNDQILNDDLVYLLENDYLHAEHWLRAVDEIYYSEIQWDYFSLYDHYDKYPFHPRFHKKYKALKASLFVTATNHWRSAPSTCGSFLVKAETLRADQFFLKRFKDRKLQPLLKLVKGRLLLTAVPGLSTHCMEGLLSPTVDWSRV
jgi:hypothetical protein